MVGWVIVYGVVSYGMMCVRVVDCSVGYYIMACCGLLCDVGVCCGITGLCL